MLAYGFILFSNKTLEHKVAGTGTTLKNSGRAQSHPATVGRKEHPTQPSSGKVVTNFIYDHHIDAFL